MRSRVLTFGENNDGGRIPAAWLRTYTIADMATIATLTDEQRAAVERYARHAGHDAERSDADEEAYREGFEDALEEAQQAVDGVFYSPPRKRRRMA